jgi:hypothetical protein
MGSPRLGSLRAIFYACVLNFVVFWIVAVLIGGDALSGEARNGRYFLSSHGHLTEVSHAVFVYSLCHVLSVFVTHPLGFVCAFLWNRDWKKYAKPISRLRIEKRADC